MHMRYDLMNVEDMHDRCEPVQPHSEPGKGDDVQYGCAEDGCDCETPN